MQSAKFGDKQLSLSFAGIPKLGSHEASYLPFFFVFFFLHKRLCLLQGLFTISEVQDWGSIHPWAVLMGESTLTMECGFHLNP